MIEADIAFDDLDAPARIADGGIFFGTSHVRPLAHRMVRAQAVDGGDALTIRIFERAPIDPRGLQWDDGPETEALDDCPLDWASLVLDRRKRIIVYRGSIIHAVPVFLRRYGGRIRIDWDYARLLGTGAADIEWSLALAHLAGASPYSPRTMVSGLYRSTAGSTMRASRGDIAFDLPEPVVRDGPQALAPGAVPEDLVFEAVRALIGARDLIADRTVAEISGGMDSALTGLAVADLCGPGVMSMGAQFDGTMGEAQRARRRLLCARGGFDDLELPAGRYAPFNPRSLRRRRFGVSPYDETYPELFETAFAALADAGIDTLVSGFGGDELYPAYVGEEEGDGSSEPPNDPPFLTSKGCHLARQAIEPYPAGPLQETCWQSAASRSQRLLRHGIWPIYPYHSPELASFVARLAWPYRKRRQLLRTILTKQLGDPVFETGYIKEDFRAIAVRGVSENRNYLHEVVQTSPVLRDDLVDRVALLAALDGDIAALSENRFNALYLALTTACFFQV